MDSRTRKRYLAQVSAMSHLLQRHYSALPKGKSYADILNEGVAAALSLGLEEVRREAVRQCVIPEPIVVDLDKLQADVPPMAAYGEPVIGIAQPLPGSGSLVGEMWGIGRGLPVGDM